MSSRHWSGSTLAATPEMEADMKGNEGYSPGWSPGTPLEEGEEFVPEQADVEKDTYVEEDGVIREA